MAKTHPAQQQPFAEQPEGGPGIRGFLHRPPEASGDILVITHGAGGNCEAPLLVSLARHFSEAGVTVLRCDLPFRQRRPHGPPYPSSATQDRAGLRAAIDAVRRIAPGGVFLGGQSYGGRQATLLSAEDSTVADGLVLLSYPLHPPKNPEKERTEHFSRLQVPALFIHGTNDPFGTRGEMEAALRLIPADTRLDIIEGAGHGLVPAKSSMGGPDAIAARILEQFRLFFDRP